VLAVFEIITRHKSINTAIAIGRPDPITESS